VRSLLIEKSKLLKHYRSVTINTTIPETKDIDNNPSTSLRFAGGIFISRELADGLANSTDKPMKKKIAG